MVTDRWQLTVFRDVQCAARRQLARTDESMEGRLLQVTTGDAERLDGDLKGTIDGVGLIAPGEGDHANHQHVLHDDLCK